MPRYDPPNPNPPKNPTLNPYPIANPTNLQKLTLTSDQKLILTLKPKANPKPKTNPRTVCSSTVTTDRNNSYNTFTSPL